MIPRLFGSIFFGLFLLLLSVPAVSNHLRPKAATINSHAFSPRVSPTPLSRSPFNYRDISIGMATNAVREKLGEPKDKSDAMDMYIIADDEVAQFYYDESKSVRAMMIIFSGDLKKAPTPRAVFGEDAVPEADGRIFKMERYPKAGYWVSYNRSAGEDPIVTIAIQRI